MPKFSANLSFLYPDLPFVERFAAAAADGFGAVEYVSPYEESKERIATLLAQHNLKQALFNFPAGKWDAGERGIACHPTRVGEFRAGVTMALDYAQALGCTQLNCLAGIAPHDVDHLRLEKTLLDNLAYASERCTAAGIKLLLEPINLRDMPGYFVSTTNHFERLLALAGLSNLHLQYDFYHMQVMQGDLMHTFGRLKDHIAHVQIADAPGRHEPGTGEINYRYVLSELDRLGYEGYVGCEYRPSGNKGAAIEWMAGLRPDRR
ncbi:Hydroxypyruvate isomerase [Devosia sp. H5989]|nr:Hydroxypyruvate isomerase [Devosia sp. H5989]